MAPGTAASCRPAPSLPGTRPRARTPPIRPMLLVAHCPPARRSARYAQQTRHVAAHHELVLLVGQGRRAEWRRQAQCVDGRLLHERAELVAVGGEGDLLDARTLERRPEVAVGVDGARIQVDVGPLAREV